jgi:hypothetical protein
VRRFLDENLTRTCARPAARPAACSPKSRLAALAQGAGQAGLVGAAWPKEHGGTGWNATQRYIFARECVAVDAPRIFAMGLRMVGPVIMKFGTPEQKAKYLPRIVSGDIVFCQGYSEPGSGSDLASLKTRAVRDGDDYVINGTKIWTTGAHVADHMFCLVRTSTEGQAAGRHLLRADRFDEDAGPHGEADRDAGRRPRGQPGVLRQRAHAGSPTASARRMPAGLSPSTCSSSSAAAMPITPNLSCPASRTSGASPGEEAADGAPVADRRAHLRRAAWPRPRWRSEALEMIEMQVLSDLSRGKEPGARSPRR